MNEKTEAVAVREVSVVSDVSPDRWAMMLSQAEAIVKSGICPTGTTKEKAAVVMLTGREFGLGAMQSLRSLFVVNNKAAMMSDMMAGLVFARLPGAKIDVVETTDTVATFEASRPGGRVTRLSFTMDDAVRAQITGNLTWKKYPAQMLRARCQAAICRLVFPDVVAGLYTPEELGEVKKSGQGEALIVEATVETPAEVETPKDPPQEATGAENNEPEVSQPKPEVKVPPTAKGKGKPILKPQREFILKNLEGVTPEDIDTLLGSIIQRAGGTVDNLSSDEAFKVIAYIGDSHNAEGIKLLRKAA